eukprot:317678-Prymnesium_polylepis.1
MVQFVMPSNLGQKLLYMPSATFHECGLLTAASNCGVMSVARNEYFKGKASSSSWLSCCTLAGGAVRSTATSTNAAPTTANDSRRQSGRAALSIVCL